MYWHITEKSSKFLFKRFHKTSKIANWIFNENPCLKKVNNYENYITYMEVVVLQVMCFGDDEFLCELIDKKLLDDSYNK